MFSPCNEGIFIILIITTTHSSKTVCHQLQSVRNLISKPHQLRKAARVQCRYFIYVYLPRFTIWSDRHWSELNKCVVYLCFVLVFFVCFFGGGGDFCSGNQNSLKDKLQLDDSLTEINHFCTTMLPFEIEDTIKSGEISLRFFFKTYNMHASDLHGGILFPVVESISTPHRCHVAMMSCCIHIPCNYHSISNTREDQSLRNMKRICTSKFKLFQMLVNVHFCLAAMLNCE